MGKKSRNKGKADRREKGGKKQFADLTIATKLGLDAGHASHFKRLWLFRRELVIDGDDDEMQNITEYFCEVVAPLLKSEGVESAEKALNRWPRIRSAGWDRMRM